jgi:hypothetical protein
VQEAGHVVVGITEDHHMLEVPVMDVAARKDVAVIIGHQSILKIEDTIVFIVAHLYTVGVPVPVVLNSSPVRERVFLIADDNILGEFFIVDVVVVLNLTLEG